MKDETRILGLKKHAEELNRLVVTSLQKALLELLLQLPYEKITVSELCRRAGVSRMAFYGNFETKDDLLHSIVVEMNEDIIREIGSPFRKTTSEEWYHAFFRGVKRYSGVLTLICNVGFVSKYQQYLNEFVLHDPDITPEKRYQRLVWSGGIVNVVSRWIMEGMKEPAEEMAQFCTKNLVPCGL